MVLPTLPQISNTKNEKSRRTSTEIWKSKRKEYPPRSKKLETAVRNAAVQMGCWTLCDDYLLITSTLQLCDLKIVYEKVLFSTQFSLKNIRDRWRCLIYDLPVSKMILTKLQQLKSSQIIDLHSFIPFSNQEELLIAKIPSHLPPTLLDDELHQYLDRYPDQFWPTRTVIDLKQCWLTLRENRRLNDQKDINSSIALTMNTSNRKKQTTNTTISDDTCKEFLINFLHSDIATRSLDNLLIPFELTFLSRINQSVYEQLKSKQILPYAILYSDNRLHCMFSKQLRIGTSTLSDLSVNTHLHIQALIILKTNCFFIVNNGAESFRVNDALLNVNEAARLGTKAVISISSTTILFQTVEP